MPYTTNKRLSVQAYNSNNNTWGANGSTGDDLNTGCFGPLDYMLAGISTFTNPSGAISLSFTAGGTGDVQQCMWRFIGTITADTTITTAVGNATTYLNGFYFWQNTTTGSFTLTLTTANGSVVLPQGRRGVLYVNNVNSIAPFIVAIAGSGTADPIPAASKVLFYNASAPAGWTAVALNDYAVKIVTNGGGAVASGSVAYSTLFARTATDGYTLLTADIPSHTHSYNRPATSLASGSGGSSGFAFAVSADTTGAAGGGGSHSHAIDMRVQTAAFVLASRD